MPKTTFLKLSEEKKNKIVEAAKREFARVSIEKVSIKNIVEEAEIARGSFYQYFDSKEDLLGYIITTHFEEMNNKIKKQLEKTKGDIFEFFISLYDIMDKNCYQKKEMEFYKKIFENTKTNQDYLISERIIKEEPLKLKNLIEEIDTSNLNIQKDDDIEIIEKILFAITNKAIVMRFKYKSKEKARENYLRQLEFLKYGILKQKDEKGGI